MDVKFIMHAFSDLLWWLDSFTAFSRTLTSHRPCSSLFVEGLLRLPLRKKLRFQSNETNLYYSK